MSARGERGLPPANQTLNGLKLRDYDNNRQTQNSLFVLLFQKSETDFIVVINGITLIGKKFMPII